MCDLWCPDGITLMSLLPHRLRVTIMEIPEALNQFWIPELDDVHHYLASISTNALVGMGAFAALTTYWLAFRQKAIKPRVDPNQQSVELPVGGLFFFGGVLSDQRVSYKIVCITLCLVQSE